MTALADAISAALIHSLWQDSMVAVLLWVALVARRSRPNARYAAGCAALALMTVLPVLTAGLLYLDAFRPDTVSSAAAAARAAVEDAEATAVWIGGGLQRVAWLARLQPWTIPLWSIGVLLFSLRLVSGCVHATALRRECEHADAGTRSMVERMARRMGVEPSIAVAISARTDGPATIGWLHPMILLPPATVLGLTPQQLDAVLAHELAHIRRHDYLVNVLQMVVETLLFYHPAVWWVSRRIRIERELCCDDLAVASSGNARCYAEALTKIARVRVTAAGMAVGARGAPLVDRIERLLGGTGAREYGFRWPALLALCLTVVSGALHVTWNRAHAQGNDATVVYSGLWEIRPATTAGSVQLRLCYAELFSRFEVPVNRLDGFSPAELADGPTRFTVRRDAGTFSFDGNVRNGARTGTYTFAPSAGFSEALVRRGFERPTTSLQHTLALHDIGLERLDESGAQGIARPGVDHIVGAAQAQAVIDDLTGSYDRGARASSWC